MTWKPIVNKAFTEKDFNDYVIDTVRTSIVKNGWRPRGVIIHNTDRPRLSEWPGVVNGKPISEAQRLRNIEHGYIADNGWSAGPHWFISPTSILAFTPAWLSGVHSPSFNASWWGLELVGNMDIEAFPPSEHKLAVHCIACLFSTMGMEPSAVRRDAGGGFLGTIGFHRDDPRTTHRACPGKNIGSKDDWVKAVRAEMRRLHPGDHIPPTEGKGADFIAEPKRRKKDA